MQGECQHQQPKMSEAQGAKGDVGRPHHSQLLGVLVDTSQNEKLETQADHIAALNGSCNKQILYRTCLDYRAPACGLVSLL